MDKLRLEPDRVPKEIVEYECTLRDIPIAGKGLTELRVALKSALDKEYAREAEEPEGEQLDFEAAAKELHELGEGARKARGTCEELEVTLDANGLRKIRSTLAHWAGRLRRFSCDEESLELKVNFRQVAAHFEVTFLRAMRIRTGGQQSAAAPAGEEQQAADDAEPHERRASVLADLSVSLSALGDPGAELADLRRSLGVKFPPDTKFFVAVEYDEASQLHVPVTDGGFPPLSPRSAAHSKKFQMYNWKLEFSGDSDSKLSLSEFLEQVEWKKRENSMTDVDLLRGAHNFFVGAARQWFKANSASWSSFADLKADLISNFRTADYDDRLWEQLRLRTQAKDERLNLYVCHMMSLFDLLETPPTEKERLDFIRARLNPFSWSHMRDLPNIASIKELISAGLHLEVVKSKIDNYRPPAAPDNPIEPNMALKGQKKGTVQVSAVGAHKKKKGGAQTAGAAAAPVSFIAGQGAGSAAWGGSAPSSNSNFVPAAATPNAAFVRKQNEQRLCWNCDKQGHVFRFCPVKKASLFCWSCGTKGVTKHNCSEFCRRSKNDQRGPSRGRTRRDGPGSNVGGTAPSGSAT